MRASTCFAFCLFGVVGADIEAACATDASQGPAIDAQLQSKLDAKLAVIKSWAREYVIVNAVNAYNTAASKRRGFTEEQWSAATGIEAPIRALMENDAAQFLKQHRTADITEAFVSGADGGKVAFLSKPTHWSHRGQAKHDVPMRGQSWQGHIELDRSSGFLQIQLAVPIIDRGKPIGSLVVGVSPARL